MNLRIRHRISDFQRTDRTRGRFFLLSILVITVGYLVGYFIGSPFYADNREIPALPAGASAQLHSGVIADSHLHPEQALEALSLTANSVTLLAASVLHFSEPAMAAPELFASTTTHVLLDPSCNKRSTFKPDVAHTLEETLFSEFGIRANARIPEGVPFEELTQFYRIGADYFQLSINALPASRPPVYELSWYRARDAQMLSQVARLAIPPSTGVLDITRASDLFTQILTTARSNRAELGARLLNVRIPGASTGATSDQELRFINGAPLQWVFGSGVCQLASDTKHALCRCLPDGEQLHVPEV